MLFYFTATGNCLYAAQQLQKQLGGELYAIPDLLRRGHTQFTAGPQEYVGFVFPVYFWGLPPILKRFATQLRISGAVPEKTFVMATMGNTSGSSCEQLEKLLVSSGIRVGYKFGVPMPDNYIPMFTMPTPEQAAQQLDESDKLLQDAAAAVRSGQTGDYNKHKGPLSGLISPLVQLAYPTKTGRFYADSSCTGCGLCQQVCPVGAIRVAGGGAPVWIKKRCETCLACLHRCPAGAIQRGKDQRGRGRYLNPRVALPVQHEEPWHETGE